MPTTDQLREERERNERGKRAIALIEEMEWDAERQGPPTGMGLRNGRSWDACPQCGGVDPGERERGADGDFDEGTFGHRSGCAIAEVLGRLTVVRSGETGELTL